MGITKAQVTAYLPFPGPTPFFTCLLMTYHFLAFGQQASTLTVNEAPTQQIGGKQ